MRTPNIVRHYSISTPEARALLSDVRSEVIHDKGKAVAAVVFDVFGNELCCDSPDDIKSTSLFTARRKAITVLRFNRATAAFRFKFEGRNWVPAGKDGWSELDITIAIASDPNFCPWAGGVPINCIVDGTNYKVGSLGISNREELEDHELAERSINRWLRV